MHCCLVGQMMVMVMMMMMMEGAGGTASSPLPGQQLDDYSNIEWCPQSGNKKMV